MRSASLVALAVLLAGCAATSEPVLVRPHLDPALFLCAPAPPKPPVMTVNDLADRNDLWAAAYDACQCQLSLLRDLLEGQAIEAEGACG